MAAFILQNSDKDSIETESSWFVPENHNYFTWLNK
jgi:hypothetical protein